SPAPHSDADATTDARHQNFNMRNVRRSSSATPSSAIESVTSAIAPPGGSSPAPLRVVPGVLPEGALCADPAPPARQGQRIGRYRVPYCREKAASGAAGVLEPRREPDPGRDVEVLRAQRGIEVAAVQAAIGKPRQQRLADHLATLRESG